MSTSLLYHGFGIRGCRYLKTDYTEGRVIFTLEQKLEGCRCAACDSGDVRPKGRVERDFRTLPIGHKQVIVHNHPSASTIWHRPSISARFFAAWPSFEHRHVRKQTDNSPHVSVAELPRRIRVFRGITARAHE